MVALLTSFLDLSIDKYMEIRRYLLLVQVKLVAPTSMATELVCGI